MDMLEYNERVRRFIKFLRKVNSKKKGENVDPTYEGNSTGVSIVFVGSAATMKGTLYGHEPYLNYIKKAIAEGVSVFYILAKGKLNSFIANYIVRLLEEQKAVNVTHDFSEIIEHRNRMTEMVCKRLEVR